MELIEKIKFIVEEVLKDRPDVEIVDLIIADQPGAKSVRLLVDKPEGILLDECARINKSLSWRFEQEDIFSGKYKVEVCSPGLDRVLKTKRDFERVLDKYIKLTLFRPVGNNNVLTGILKEVSAGSIRISDKEEIFDVDLDNIKRAKLEVRW